MGSDVANAAGDSVSEIRRVCTYYVCAFKIESIVLCVARPSLPTVQSASKCHQGGWPAALFPWEALAKRAMFAVYSSLWYTCAAVRKFASAHKSPGYHVSLSFDADIMAHLTRHGMAWQGAASDQQHGMQAVGKPPLFKIRIRS